MSADSIGTIRIGEACRLLGVTKATLRGMVARGEVPGARWFGGQLRFTRDGLRDAGRPAEAAFVGQCVEPAATVKQAMSSFFSHRFSNSNTFAGGIYSRGPEPRMDANEREGVV